jgi:hypothetical protein
VLPPSPQAPSSKPAAATAVTSLALVIVLTQVLRPSVRSPTLRSLKIR